MKRLLRTPLAATLGRLALLYAVLMLCRIVFYCYNAATIGALGGHWGELLAGALKFDTASVLYADLPWIVAALLPLPMHIRNHRWYAGALYWYYVAVNGLLIVAVNLADCIYFRYTQKRFTADEIFFADNDNSAQLVLKFAAENWPIVLIGAALIALLAAGYRRRAKPESILSEGWSYYTVSSAVWIAALLASVAGMRGGMTRMTRPITLSNATLYAATNEQANLILSNPFCILRTVGSSGKIAYQRYYAPEELERIFTPVHTPANSAAVDLTGRNVMIFIMESMSAEHSAHLSPDLYAGREEQGYTPFLDSLMRSGLVFRRMYANGTRSIQAMPSVLGSIPSFKTPFVLMPQSLGASRQLPAILAGRGYSTAFFCGSEHGSMGFGAYARSAGVERLVSREDYEARHGRNDFDGYWGIWDEPFLQFAGEELGQMPEPFCAALFTLNAHHPFVVPGHLVDSLPKGVTRNHPCVAYDDRAFRLFFDRFGREEWFRRTIFVFVADHVSSEKFAPETQLYPENHRIIGFLYTPDGALRGEVDEVTQQIDLMPTLLGLLGQREPYFAYGRDVLNEPQRPHWAVSYGSEFQAVTDEGCFTFDEEHITSATPDSTAAARYEAPLKALIQQYYTRIERKNYTAGE